MGTEIDEFIKRGIYRKSLTTNEDDFSATTG